MYMDRPTRQFRPKKPSVLSSAEARHSTGIAFTEGLRNPGTQENADGSMPVKQPAAVGPPSPSAKGFTHPVVFRSRRKRLL